MGSERRDTPRVEVIILNWNNAADTLACLESVFQMDYPNFSVLVVDNGSTDDSVAQFRSIYPDLDLLLTGDNLGYAGGNNAGISKALVSGAEYICILNNDTVVEPDFLSALVQEMDADSRIGVAGPMMYFYDSPSMVFSAGCDIDWRRGIVHHRGMGILVDDGLSMDLAEAQDVDAIAGCGFLVSRAAIDRAGYFDPTYFLNYEDIDWCVRIARCGFRVRYVPAARLYHKVSATQGQDSPATTYYMTRNALWFFGRHSPRRVSALATILCRTARTLGAWTFQPKFHNDKYRQHRRAAMRAVSDFFRGRTGPAPSLPITIS